MKSIMLVTDSTWVQNDVAASIIDPDVSLTVVDDPRTVVANASSNPVGVFLVDMQVGSMGGMAVTRAIKAAMNQGVLDDHRVLMLLDRSADEFIAKRAGADGWVIKPFTAQALRAALG